MIFFICIIKASVYIYIQSITILIYPIVQIILSVGDICNIYIYNGTDNIICRVYMSEYL
jgi:energy-converting hydrogenase Eha subunit C